MKTIGMLILALAISGCSTLSFTRNERKFDGTVHSVSSLLCTGYWATHDWQGQPLNRPFYKDAASFSGLAVYGVVDLGSSLVADAVFLPIQALGGGPDSAAFDKGPHKLFPCGTLQHSINTIGAM